MQGQTNGKMPAPPPPLVVEAQKPAPQGANGAAAMPPPPVETPKAPEVDPRLRDLETQTKRIAQHQRKLAEKEAALEKTRAETETKAKEYEEWQQYRANLKRNPIAFLKKEFGENYYDTLTRVHLDGVPTADLVASEMDGRFSEYEKKLQAKEAEYNKRFEELNQRDTERLRAEYFQGVIGEVKKDISKYQHLEAFADDESVWGSVAREIDKHFVENQRAILAGDMEMLTPHEAATRVDKQLEPIFNRVLTAAQKRQSATGQPPERQQAPAPPVRRSLSTDMTASSGAEWTPPKNDDERHKRAMAAFENARRK